MQHQLLHMKAVLPKEQRVLDQHEDIASTQRRMLGKQLVRINQSGEHTGVSLGWLRVRIISLQ
jgi:hypothetical protein